MSPAIIVAIGIGTATALVMALLAARQAGGTAPEESYGRELDMPRTMGGRRLRPGVRPRAMIAIVIAALAAIAAGIVTALSQGPN